MPELLLQRGDVFVDPFVAVAFVLARILAADEALDDAFLMPTGKNICIYIYIYISDELRIRQLPNLIWKNQRRFMGCSNWFLGVSSYMSETGIVGSATSVTEMHRRRLSRCQRASCSSKNSATSSLPDSLERWAHDLCERHVQPIGQTCIAVRRALAKLRKERWKSRSSVCETHHGSHA